MKLERFSVRRPMTVFVAVILVIILGVISFMNMTPNLLPNIDFPYVVAYTSYYGASPERIETGVTKVIETALASVGGLKNISSTSSENASIVVMEFEQNTDLDGAMIEISSKLDLVRDYFDEGVSSPALFKINPSMLPVMMAAVDIEGLSGAELTEKVDTDVIPAFERIGGVASVSATGSVTKTCVVTLESDKIDEINKKVLAAADEKLADAETQLADAEQKLADARAEYESQKAEQTGTVVDAGKAIAEGKLKLEQAMNELLSAEIQVANGKTGLAMQKAAYELKTGFGLELTEEEQAKVAEVDAQLAALETKEKELAEGKKQIEAQQQALTEKESELESGKIELTTGLASAESQMSAGESELESKKAELESAKEQAEKSANLDSLLSESTLKQVLAAQNISLPAGYAPTEDGEDKILVKIGGKFGSTDEIGELVLASTGIDGVGDIKVSDVARVEMTDDAGDSYAKINGSDGLILSFTRQSESATATVSDDIKSTITELENSVDGLHVTVLMDQGKYIDVIISSVLQNLLWGALLAILVLLLFLRNLRPTVIIACSIPISVLFALALMYFSGVTLNIISMCGLALGVGMLVDNSIVVIENIYRLRAEGMSAPKAAVAGAKQVASAITASTLTTVCVFLPIVFTDGISRQLFTDMGLTVGYSLMASLIVALTLVPAMSAGMLRKPDNTRHGLFDRFVGGYKRALAFCLRKKWVVLVPTVALLAASVIYVTTVGTSFMPEMNGTQVSATLAAGESDTTDGMREAADELAAEFGAIDGVKTVGAMQGGSSIMSMGGGVTKDVTFYVILNDNASSKAVAEKMKEISSAHGRDIEVETSQMDMSALGGSGISVTVDGTDLDALRSTAAEVKTALLGVEGIASATDGSENSTEELRVTVDKAKAIEYGLTSAQVYQAVAAVLADDAKATTVELSDGSSIAVAIGNTERGEVSDEKVGDILISGTKDNEPVSVKLGDIASIERASGSASIKRLNGSRTISVSAELADGYNVGLVGRDVEKALASVNVSDGCTVALKGENETINQAMHDLILMLLLAVVFIYLIMVAVFQSLLSPFVVMFTLPLAFTGGIAALLITGKEVSVISMLGFLVLAGIIVNNGIVFVDYANQMRLGGIERRDALVRTGGDRLRPILMTALTTILGLVTLACGMGQGAELAQPLAIVVIGGLLYATLMTLFVVPCLYDIFMKKPLKNREKELESEDKPEECANENN